MTEGLKFGNHQFPRPPVVINHQELSHNRVHQIASISRANGLATGIPVEIVPPRYPRPATRYFSAMRLFHRDLGGAGHPPLVLLHGLLGSSRNWQTAGADLAGRYHVLAVDLRNHGASAHAPTMSYPEMMADVLAWLDDQG